MKLFKFFVLSFLLLRICIINVSGQFQKPDVGMPSPNAMSLGTFGVVPVSYFTGVPQISVPLYNIKEGALDLPISLDYHASGVKVDQHPSWVGLNWNLSAGGAITREVRDLPDEFDCNAIIKRLPFLVFGVSGSNNLRGNQAGYYFRHNINGVSNWASSTNIQSVVNNAQDKYDTEPDVFNFNFMGHSGKFFLDENGAWQIQSDEPIKVVFDNTNFLDLPSNLMSSVTTDHANDQYYTVSCIKDFTNVNPKCFGGFTLITDDGTQFVFGGTQTDKSTDAIEFSIPYFQQITGNWVADSWYLKSIKLTDGKTINFIYQPDAFLANMYLSFLWYLEVPFKNSSTVECALYTSANQLHGFGNNEEEADWINPRFASYLGSLVRPTYLSAIQTSSLEIDFNRSESHELKYDTEILTKNAAISYRDYNALGIACGDLSSVTKGLIYMYAAKPTNDINTLVGSLSWKKLNSIIIKKRDLSPGGIEFDLSYNDISTERLMLKSIEKKTLNSSVINSYKFYYYQDVTLPNYLTESADHWGFNNGNTTKCFTRPRTDDLVNDMTSYINLVDQVKAPTLSLAIARSGSLQKIFYPTGGSTEFVYEQNDYSNVVNINRTQLDPFTSKQVGGGLRIRKIINNAGDLASPSVEKEYFYVNGYFKGYDPSTSTLPSSGILGGKSQYYYVGNNTNSGNPYIQYIAQNVLSAQNILPYSINNTGIHIGYSEVTEKLSDGSFTTYKFTNFETPEGKHYDERPEASAASGISYSIPFTDKSIERGRLISKQVFSSAGSPLVSSIFSYQALSQAKVRSLAVAATTYICFETDFTSYTGYCYYNYYYKYLPLKQSTYTYDQNDPTKYTYVGKTFNSYTNLGQVKAITDEIEDSQFMTTYKYPADFSVSSTSTGNAEGLYMLQSQNMSPVVEKYVEKKNSQGLDEFVSGDIQLYKKNPNNTSQVVPDVTYKLDISMPLPGYSVSGTTTNSMTFDSHYRPRYSVTYDANKNLQSVKDIYGYNTSLLWDQYNNSIIGKVANADPNQIYHTSFEDASGSLDADAKTGAKVSTTPVTVSLTNVPNGTYMFTYWQRGSSGWAPNQSTVNITNGSFSQTILASPTNPIDEVRFYPPTAQISTFTTDPFSGKTSSMDSNQVVEYYQYDDAGRLQFVKDFNHNVLKAVEYIYQVK